MLIVVLTAAALASLGVWQLHRADEKQRLLQRYESAPRLPALEAASDLGADWRDYRYRKIRLGGAYEAGRQVLLENQFSRGRVGFMVLTPFILADSGEAVMVNRGWIADSGNAAGEIKLETNPRRVSGLVNHPPAVGMKLGSPDDSKRGWPKPMPYLDMEWMSLQLGRPVLPWVLLLDSQEADGYHRDWRPTIAMGPERHKGYAAQWFSLSVALIFLFVVGSMKPENSAADRGDKGQAR